ncbi:MAG TPA: hypothetical protein DCZ92_07170 [Elusimicrobia bacterium]|nr:MAG: hypothetical protein A2016_02835 [Elusimicrobia bacterium GWF2_62_30]HBA60586.1 hypothetical protein [Elusimicrobiota bacterium]
MKRKLVNAAALFCLLAPLAYGQAAPGKKQGAIRPAQPRAEAATAAAAGPELPVLTPTDLEVEIGDIDVRTPVTGITTAQETFDVFSPFDGRIEEVRADIFTYIAAQEVLARMVSTEMAALLDSTPEEGKNQTARRWQDVYKFYDIKSDFEGVVTNVYVEPKSRVYKGDRLFTVAKKVIIVGRNTAKLYTKLGPDMSAEIANIRNPEMKFKAKLTNFLPLKGSRFFNRLWLEVLDLRNGIKIGQQFEGELYVGKNTGTRLVPRRQLVEFGGRKYLLMEVETGLCTEEKTEIIKPGTHYLGVKYSQKEPEDINDRKTR